jgi:hypothetical protein
MIFQGFQLDYWKGLMDMISVIAKDADPHETIAGADVKTRTGNKADGGAGAGAATGGAAGGIGGLLVGLGALVP